MLKPTGFVICVVVVFASAFFVGFQVGRDHPAAHSAALLGAASPVAAGQVSIAECEARMDAVGKSGIAALEADRKSCLEHINAATDACTESQHRVAANCLQKMDALDAQWRADFTALARQKGRPLPKNN